MFDLKEIKEQFKSVITNSQGITNPNVDSLFDDWYKAKEKYIKAMGNNLIYEYEYLVSFNLNESQKVLQLNNFIEDIIEDYGLHELGLFLDNMKDCFYSNITLNDYKIPYSDTIIKKGTKIVKDFKYFISDKILLANIQDKASRLIQQNKVEGKICVSVHPLDYLTLSENNHNWRSCHALDGDFRAGNLSYMMDQSTIICYIKSIEDTNLRYFSSPWNNKKWRVLLFFSNDGTMIFAGRQYPFESEQALNFITSNLLHRSGIIESPYFYLTPWHDEKIKILPFNNETRDCFMFKHPHYPVGNGLVADTDLIIDKSNLYFNDLLNSNFYSPVYAFRKSEPDELNLFPTGDSHQLNTRFYIGGNVKCLQCGKELIIDSDTMFCDDCDYQSTTYTCEKCGHPFHIDDMRVSPDGETVLCECCYNNIYIQQE